MALQTSEVNVAVDAVAARATHLSVHTADPATTGAAEATGGSYARVALVWPAATAGSSTAGQVTVEVPAGTYTHYGLWGALTGTTTWRGGNPLSTTETFGAAGQLKVTASIPGTAS